MQALRIAIKKGFVFQVDLLQIPFAATEIVEFAMRALRTASADRRLWQFRPGTVLFHFTNLQKKFATN